MPGDNCRSCGNPIVWAVTKRGKNIPIDPQPTPNGNILLRDNIAGHKDAVYLSAAIQPNPGEKKYTSHFATCPNSKAHRGKKRGKG